MTRRQMLAAAAASAPLAMAKPSELCLMTSTELARRLRKKEVSARELLDAHLKHIESVNPKVNAIVTLVADKAREQAKLADEAAAKGRFLGPLHGLPMAHKDLKETRGIRTTFGSPLFRDYVPNFTSLPVERMQQAGGITIGKTNTPEFGAGSQTFNPVFGATKNPYDLTRTCGGSSGGAAVALACGLVPVADGSDTGGSLRNPASFCSVVGFRPSVGRVPVVPTGAAWNSISVTGPMGRSVADTAMLLSVMAGPDPRAPLALPDPGSVFAKPLDRDMKGIRIGWCGKFAGLPFDRRITAVFEGCRKHFAALGCVVEDVNPDFSDADDVFRVLRALSFYQQHAAKVKEHRSEIKDTVLQEVDLGASVTGPQIADAEARRSRLFVRVAELLSKYELFVLPTTQVPPFSVDQPYITEIEGTKMKNYIEWMGSCYYITVTGLPAISVPGGYTPEGLPVGVQIVGRNHDDWGVLQAGHAFEKAANIRKWPAVALS